MEIVDLPVNSPAEAINISPEALEVANTYLQTQDMQVTADSLNIPLEIVSQFLDRREVRAYIDSVFANLGFNNRFKLAAAMDAIIAKKFKDMDEADVGSNKDISELLLAKHKMAMEHLDREIKLATLKQANSVKTQTNIQINEGNSNYSTLIEKLLSNSNN